MSVYYIHEKISSSPKTVALTDATPQSNLAESDSTWLSSFIQGMRDVGAVLVGLLLFLLMIGSVPLAFSLAMYAMR